MGWRDTNLNLDPSEAGSSGLVWWRGKEEILLLLDGGLTSCNSFDYDYFVTLLAFIFTGLEIERLNV
jgi:hypothetical protein